MAKSLQNMPPIFSAEPAVMGVVNVTPDSFSDGGQFISHDKAIAHGLKLMQEGAHILDIGGESSRPGAEVVDPQEEIARVVPVIEGLRGRAAFISIDTRNAVTMEAALKAGANIVNDISALSYDPQSIHIISEAQVPVILMHMQGTPQTMQKSPSYRNAVDDIYQYFQMAIDKCVSNRIEMKNIILDPGIGFGKTLEHNVLILRNIKRFLDLGPSVLLGVSRKSFIGQLSAGEPAHERFPGSIAAALWARSQGVQIYRVHDVKETVQAFKIYEAISSAS